MAYRHCTITPNRGQERHQFLDFCKLQLQRLPHERAYIIDYPPKSNAVDLVERVQEGIKLAKQDGYEYAFIIESDDYYPANYFNIFSPGFDFYGCEITYYYNLKNKTWAEYKHPGRSSLFCTGFRISALSTFQWPDSAEKFLDIAIWKHAERTKASKQLLKHNPATGMKHGIGKVGGKAHSWEMRNKDNDFRFLRSRVDSQAFEFYSEMHETLKH